MSSVSSAVSCGQQLADAEVQQHDAPVGRHENVRRLEIAVNDQLGVRELHRFHRLHEQAQPLADAEQALVAAVDQLRAGDVLHREIRLAGFADAGVVQSRDVGMRERREDVALAQEALDLHARSGQRQLERDFALELAVAALGEPHAAHAADADLADQPIRSDDVAGVPAVAGFRLRAARAGQPRGMPRDDVAQRGREILDAGERRAFQKTCCVQRGALREQSTNGLGDVRPTLGELAEPGRARLLIQLQRAIEIRLDVRPRQLLAFSRMHCSSHAGEYPAMARPGFYRPVSRRSGSAHPDVSLHKRSARPIVRCALAKPVANVWNRPLGGLCRSILGNIHANCVDDCVDVDGGDGLGRRAERSGVQKAEAKAEATAETTAEATATKASCAGQRRRARGQKPFKPPAGYRPKRVNGEQVYCTKIVMLGSTLPEGRLPHRSAAA